MTIFPAKPRSGASTRALALAITLMFSAGSGVFCPAVALAATKARKGTAAPSVTVNFVNAEIEGVARAMAAIIDRQIVVDPRVKGTITLYSEQPVTAREAYLNFLSALRGQGFALIEVAGMLKVVPEADAKLQAGVVEVGNVSTRSGDQILTQIFRLQHEQANSLVAVLRPLISPNNTINANPATNTLVITDYADNLKRLGQIIAAMDVPASTDMEAIPMQFAMASDLVPVIQRFADGASAQVGTGAGGGPTVVMADARTNTLLIKANNPARLNMLRAMVQRLDKPGTNGLGGSGINVVYLKNSDAVKLAAVLRAAFPLNTGGGGAGGGLPAGGGAAQALNVQAGASGGATGASPQATSPVAASAQPSTGGYIQADPATNSLIITAPDAIYRQLRSVIDQLDGRRAQIFIEAMIVKVNANKISSLGVQWAGANGNRTIVGAGTSLKTGRIPGLTDLVAAGSAAVGSLGGLNVALARKLADGTISLGALATFLQTEADGNVLSTPNLITLDNEEAKIVVGSNVPFVTGSFSNTGASNGSANPFQTIERKDVGLTLRVRPQVGEGGTVRMTIFQEDASIDADTKSAQNGPSTTKSSIETSVVIDDGQVMVLGGLMKDEYSDSQNKVPLLGDIPGLGFLFKAQERSRSKTNLMVFLRPVVMRTQEASNALTLDRYDYMRQRQGEMAPTGNNPVLGINEVPRLEPFKLSNGLSVPMPMPMPMPMPPSMPIPPSVPATPPQ